MFKIEYYAKADGTVPVVDWLFRLQSTNRRVAATIVARIERVEGGLLGDHKPVGDGVSELRIATGPGYRVYYSLVGRDVVLLLAAGPKKSQSRDIKTAKRFLAEYRSRKQ